MSTESNAVISRICNPNDRANTRPAKRSILYKIFSSAALVTLITLGVKVLAMAKEILVAQRFGVGDDLDCFLMAYLLPQFLINVLAGAFTSSFIPVFSEAIQKKGIAHGRQVLREASTLLIGILVVSSFTLYIFTPLLLPVIASGFNAEKMAQTQLLSIFLLPTIFINGLSTLYASVLNSRHKYAIPALLPALTPIAIVVLLLNFKDVGINALPIGILLGVFVELLLLTFLVKKAGWLILPKLRFQTEELRQLLNQYSHRMIAVLLMSSTSVIDQSMAAFDSLPAGSVAALGYGNRIVNLALGIGGSAIGTVLLSHYSELVANKNWDLIQKVTSDIQKTIFLISSFFGIILAIFSDDIIAIMFQRGNFTENDTLLVSGIQKWYLLQVPFYLMAMVGNRLITAMGKAEILTKMTLVNTVFNVIGNIIFIRYLGVPGIALSTSLVFFVYFSQITIYLHHLTKINS